MIQKKGLDYQRLKTLVEKVESLCYDLLANPDENRSELMRKPLNYLKSFWNQIFTYRNDGEYPIDNLPAEQALNPVTTQQKKNSLLLGNMKRNTELYSI